MDPPVVYIEKEPFKHMLLAAVDVFKKECFGYVFGRKPTRINNRYRVTDVIVLQSVIRGKDSRARKFTEIDHMKRSRQRMFEIFDSYSRLYPLLGDFHSHPEYGTDPRSVELSDRDIMDMKDASWCKIAFVIRISTRTKERLEWYQKQDGGVRGSFGCYVVDVNVYRLIKDNGDRIPQSLVIISPAIKALNRANNKKKR